MKIYLTEQGAALLQNSQINAIPKPFITGSQVYSAYGFVPDTTLPNPAFLLIDNRTNANSVKYTPINMHELLLSVFVDQTFEFAQIGSIVLFMQDQPFLWSVSDTPLGKLKTNPISHFAGDEYFFDYLLKYAYISEIIDLSNLNPRIAKFPDFLTIADVTIPPHTLANQAVIEQNTLFYGNNRPAVLSRGEFNNWIGIPFMNPLDTNLYKVDSGSTLSGQ
jgi:hypothetical protein